MNFYEGKEKEIIKKYSKNNDWYEILYLNGECDYYYNPKKEHELEIQEKMLKQAIKRYDELYKKYKSDNIKSTILFLISLPTSYLSISRNLLINFLISSLIASIALTSMNDLRKKLKELKKYKIFIEIRKDLEKSENRNILDIIEFDKMYQKPLNINTLDEYNLWEIKCLKKEIDRRNKIHV